MTMLSGSELLFCLILGSFLAIDQNVGLYTLLSQPLIGAAAAGAITGHFEASIAAGAIVQWIWLVVQPVGGARTVDAATAGITAGVSVPASVTATESAWLDDPRLTGAVVVAVLMAYAAGGLLLLQRRLHAWLLRDLGAHIQNRDAAAVERLHLATIGLHGIRGALAVGVGVLLMPVLAEGFVQHGLLVPVGRLALGLGAVTLVRFSTGFKNVWLLAGALAGLLLGVV